MVHALKVFKKTSPNGLLTVYLGKRDFVDNITKIEAVDGVALVEGGNLKGRRLFGQVVCSFRYGREEDEVMGLQFQKDLLMASGEIKETCNHELTKMQARLVKKLGPSAWPFTYQLPKNAPPSVTLRPAVEASGKPCGVEYFLKIFIGDRVDDIVHKRSSVTMGIRVLQFAPSHVKETRHPCTVVRRDFVMSPGQLELELNLDHQLFHHGDTVKVHMAIINRSNKVVKKIRAQVLQCIDVCLFEHGTYKTAVASIDSTDGCPVQPGGTLHRSFALTPLLGSAVADRHGVALDGRLNNEDTDLASTTLMANSDDRDGFGIIVTYQVKVRLFLGALSGEVVGELPIILMHPKPNPKRLPKMDSVAFESFPQDDSIDESAKAIADLKLGE